MNRNGTRHSIAYRRFQKQLKALREHRIATVMQLAARARRQLEHMTVHQYSLLQLSKK